MNLSPKLLSVLRDPIDHSALAVEADALINPANRRRYPIIDGIPVLLEESDVGPQNLRLRDMYRWMAGGFDVADRMGNLLMLGFITKARRYLAGELDLKPGERCLYTSIGTGLDLPFLAERVALEAVELIGLDLSGEMLRQCQRKLRRWPRPALVQANAERLPFADESFDAVFHLGGINLFDRPAMAVQEMARVAKPNGRVLVADETAEVVRKQYQGWNPFTRKACRGISTDFDPRDWIPSDAVAPSYDEIFKGKGYLMKFRTAG